MAKLTVAGIPIDEMWRTLDPRVQAALQSADMLIAEEKKSALRLLAATESREKPLELLNEHSDIKDIYALADKVMELGHTVFVSDAGTPCIADPDYRLVDECIKRGVEIHSVPGPSSIITALSVSGFPADSFTFLGFPPKEEKDRKAFFAGLSTLRHTSIFLERPYAFERTLEELSGKKLEISLSIALGSPGELNLRGTPEELKEKVKRIKAPFAVVIKKNKKG